MPNWCECDLSIRGDAGEIDRLLEERGGEFDGKRLAIDFDKVIPYPREFAWLDEACRVEDKQVSPRA